jgi:hypothetical protein
VPCFLTNFVADFRGLAWFNAATLAPHTILLHLFISTSGCTSRVCSTSRSPLITKHQSFCCPATIEVSSSTCELSFCTNFTRSATLAAVAAGAPGDVAVKRFEAWGSLVGVVGSSRFCLLAARLLPGPAWQAESGRPGDLGGAVDGRGKTLCEMKRLLFS